MIVISYLNRLNSYFKLIFFIVYWSFIQPISEMTQMWRLYCSLLSQYSLEERQIINISNFKIILNRYYTNYYMKNGIICTKQSQRKELNHYFFQSNFIMFLLRTMEIIVYEEL